MDLKNIYDNLTDEQKEKVKACKTADEFQAFAEKEGIELTDEMLDEVACGLKYPFEDHFEFARRWGREHGSPYFKQNINN